MPHRGIIVAPDQSNDVPLPEGVDPKNVEDIFLSMAPVAVPAEWSDEEDEVSCSSRFRLTVSVLKTWAGHAVPSSRRMAGLR